MQTTGMVSLVALLGISSASAGLDEWFAGNPGQLYANKQNPLIQEFSLNGRLHWQYAAVDGRSDGREFHYENHGDIRRFYFGPTVKFLNGFTLMAQGSWVDDQEYLGGDREVQYTSIFEAYLTADLKKLLEVEFIDALKVSYGKIEMKFTEEHDVSSKNIVTVERSMLDSYILPGVPSANPTGATFEIGKGIHSLTAGVFSTTPSLEISNWDDGQFYFLTYRADLRKLTGWKVSEAAATFVQNDTEDKDAQAMNYDWLTTLWGRIGDGPWAVGTSLIYGENRAEGNRGGSFGGVDVIPTWWLVPEKLQLAFRGEIAGATEAEGLRLASRYTRAAGAPENEDIPLLANGRGDLHYSLYGGVNYFFSHPNLKLMAGVEWERMENTKADLTVYEGVTCSMAARVFF